MKTPSPLATRIATAAPSPVVTPDQLIAFGEAMLDEIRLLIDTSASRSPLSRPLEKLKAYSSVADLHRATGLSRERICRLVNKHPEIRTIADSAYSSYRRIHTADFLTLVSSLSLTPNPPTP